MDYAVAQMAFSECLVTWLEVKAKTKADAIREMVDHVAKIGLIQPTDITAIVRALALREKHGGSTGYGKGIANPHAKTPLVSKFVIAFGRSRSGLDWEALDLAPVHLLTLLLSPLRNPDGHLAMTERLMSFLQRDLCRLLMLEADSVDDILDLLQEFEITIDTQRSSRSQYDVRRWIRMFTPTELALLRLLVRGVSLADAAQSLGLSHETAEKRETGIWAKLRSGRQA